jgi:putative SOS response-associated peptidase YedK
MCGRFTQQRPSSELAQIFDAEDLAASDGARFPDGARFNVAPTTEALVVVQREAQRAVVRYRWGLIPPWSDDPRIASKTFNARAETVTTSPMFRDAFRKRRCLVPVDGFYEWRREGTKRHPTRIVDPSGAPLALAGLWTGRQDPESGEWRRTFTIVTTRPNAFMTAIHDRMPVIIPPADWAAWLDAAGADPAEVRAMLEPREDVALDAYEVSDLVNNVRNDGPALILPAGSAQDPAEPRDTLF